MGRDIVSNDEIRMTKEARNPNDEESTPDRHSELEALGMTEGDYCFSVGVLF
jgi:hypothetical protein